MHRRTDKDTHAIQAPYEVIIIAVNKSKSEPSESKVFAKTPHKVGSLRVWELQIIHIRKLFYSSHYLILWNAENTIKT